MNVSSHDLNSNILVMQPYLPSQIHEHEGKLPLFFHHSFLVVDINY